MGNRSLPPGLEALMAVNDRGTQLRQQDQVEAQQSKLMAAAPELAKMAQSGDVMGAFARLVEINPNIAADPLAKMFAENPQFKGQQQLAQTKGQLDAQSPFGANPRQMLDAQLAAQERLAQQKAVQPKALKDSLTPFEKKRDETIATQLADTDSKFLPKIQKSIQNLKIAEDLLKKGKGAGSLRSKAASVLPDTLTDLADEDQAIVRDNIQDTVFQSLKELLGGQFSQREGERLVANTFNPRVPAQENLRRLQILKQNLLAQAQAKKAIADYVKQFGTTKGYEGPEFILNSADYTESLIPSAVSNSAKGTKNPALEAELRRRGLLK